jgi:hypothetical protein
MNAAKMSGEFCRIRYVDHGGADIGLYPRKNILVNKEIFFQCPWPVSSRSMRGLPEKYYIKS